jgi:hypothetical protein
VEAEAAHALVAKARGEQVGAGDLGQRPVECRIEDGNMCCVRQRSARSRDRLDGGGVVQRRQFDQRGELGQHRIVDPRRIRESRSPVDDTMADGCDRRRVAERCNRP